MNKNAEMCEKCVRDASRSDNSGFSSLLHLRVRNLKRANSMTMILLDIPSLRRLGVQFLQFTTYFQILKITAKLLPLIR